MAFFKTIWKVNSKHEKLSEELALQSQKEIEEEQTEMVNAENDLTFKLKYLGSTVVEKILGPNVSAEAVKNILKTTKAAKGRKKLRMVNINVSLQGITATDQDGNDILTISIYNISNCSTDPTHRQIFSFISTDPAKTSECHAFLCPRRKIAETVTLAVAHAFTSAYEAWRQQPFPTSDSTKTAQIAKDSTTDIGQVNVIIRKVEEEKLIDFDDGPFFEDELFCIEKPPSQNSTDWVCFEDDFLSGTSPKVSQKTSSIFA